ncbi:MAG: thiamine pyrophosphate-dependent enzyme [Candidatus Berkelbacteria bacterium]|nr:thiamine pyrophosphate-dependent enzyme [Candidatus Berkelbacteria bacterium]
MKLPDEKFGMPACFNVKSKPSLFCPGCGESMILKHLGAVIDNEKIQSKITLAIDIGCTLLSWDYYNFDIIQTHHGRSVPTAVGYKMARDKRIVIALMGDGGAYAIGLQSLLHAAFRNDPILAIVINNTEYSMTGGQMAPTSLPDEITSTSPLGKNASIFGPAFHGPELVRQIANPKAFIARSSVSNPIMMETIITKALKNQITNKSFSMVEILSICPTNWKMNAAESFEFLAKLEKVYPVGEIIKNKSDKDSKSISE